MASPADVQRLRFQDEAERKRGQRISHMFDRIAPTYDLLNHLLSGNVDARWRKTAVKLLGLNGTERALDACTGTGDLAIALKKGGAGEVVGTDFAPAMLEVAREKEPSIRFDVADTTALPFPDDSFDVATVGFGVRNLDNLDAGLADLCRVLRPGGRLMVLEFNRPPNPVFRAIYHTYFMIVLPIIGNLVSGGADNAYAYLPRSVMAFPGPTELADRMRGAGFSEVEIKPLTFGVAYVHIATK
ncbi:MAG: bifunctional demethylmenaquinone methyltransferase/2-methoxy-6-polyprenyl-1,4-benzoquinol methylase UbiE [Planctomycetota bacterium]|nr:bifunctional demethylmenaquinone methyltransferase/2-methoxy-6-polyprenyl-1,4-benzoquinol methylase UbiE [Planctomycetota bacterium]